MPTAKHPLFKELHEITVRSGGGWEALVSAIDEQHALLEKRDREAALAGEFVGRYISEPFADGYAYYLITAADKSKRTVRIQHLSVGDAWVIPYWGADATIKREYAERSLNARDRLAELLSARPQQEQGNASRKADRGAGKVHGPRRP